MNHIVLPFIDNLAYQLSSVYKNSTEQHQTAWWMLEAITNKTQAQLISMHSIEFTEEQEKKLYSWIKQHTVEQKPLQYILESVPFGPLTLTVRPPILIPRPETEEWSIWLASELKRLKNKKIKILDLCTGSGCIALLLGSYLPEAIIIATDISPEALALARENAVKNKINNVSFVQSDLFESLDPSRTKFDLIVANPPYISSTEWKQLDPMVQRWEDKNALISDHHGLSHVEKILKRAPEFIAPNDEIKKMAIPQLMIEIGHRQGPAVKELLQKTFFQSIRIKKDLEGKDRVLMARTPS